MIPLLACPRHPDLRVADFRGKGRGLVAGAAIPSGTLLEQSPVLPLRAEELGRRQDGLYSYPFDWPDPPFVEAIALGLISLINHSDTPNADFDLDIPNKAIRLYAKRDLAEGEEITIDYGIPLWFERA